MILRLKENRLATIRIAMLEWYRVAASRFSRSRSTPRLTATTLTESPSL